MVALKDKKTAIGVHAVSSKGTPFEIRKNPLVDSLSSTGVKNNTLSKADWLEAARGLLAFEGNVITLKGDFAKNPYMRLLEDMAKSSDSGDKVIACLALGRMKVDFPEFADRTNFPKLSAWIDDMLIILGTDKRKEVRDAAIVALNMKGAGANLAELIS
ncbi:MAG: hypothetical protein V1909_01275 [Candidatus Micrarchaeota archaeon]